LSYRRAGSLYGEAMIPASLPRSYERVELLLFERLFFNQNLGHLVELVYLLGEHGSGVSERL